MSFKDKIFKNQSPWGTPPPGGVDPQGDWFLKILSLKLITLYIVTFVLKTSYVGAILCLKKK